MEVFLTEEYRKLDQEHCFNTRIKVYPNGRRMITYSNKRIFHRPLDEFDQETDIIWAERKLPRAIDPETGALLDEADTPNDEKDEYLDRQRAMLRAKAKVFDIAFCNADKWKYFLTITFDDRIQDAADISGVMCKLSKWLNNMQQRKGLTYLLLPEYHKKGGRVHCHALVSSDAFHLEDSGCRILKGEKRPKKLETIKRLGKEDDIELTVYNVTDWKYGFSTATPIYGDGERLTAYVTKYVTKSVKKIFGKFYWSSHDLVREPEIIYENRCYDAILEEEHAVPGTPIRLKYVTDSEFTLYQRGRSRFDEPRASLPGISP